MEFDNNGNLLGEILTNYTLDDIENYLVTPFSKSTTRRYIFNNLVTFIKGLPPQHHPRIWLDGSFCTNKENPNDIDCLVFVGPSPPHKYQFNTIRAEHLVYKNYKLDVYPCFDKELVDPADESYPIFQESEKQWQEKFGYDRNGNPKAIIELRIGDTHV